MSEIRVQIPKKLGQLFSGKADYRGAYGGRGAAKTIAFANMAIVDILEPATKPWKFLCGRELQKSLKDSVFSVIAGQIPILGVQDKFDVGKEYIRCKNGNEFLFYGLRTNIAEVKGLHGVRRTWLEEAQKVSESSLTYLIPTVMRDFPDCELWASWNPDDEEDPVHKIFVANADDTVKAVKVNWYDNPWFPESLNKVRLRDLKHNPQRYEWIWEGNFNTNADGAVYGKWITDMERGGRVKGGIYDPSLPIFTAWDLGFSDDTAIWWFQVAGNEVRLVDYYENNREGVRHYAEVLYGREIVDIEYAEHAKIIKYKLGQVTNERRAEYTYAQHYVPHDAANKLQAAGGRSIVQQLFELGIKCSIIPATSQQNQIESARLTLERTWADSETCKEGLRALRKYQFLFDEQRNKYLDKPDHDGYSHSCDAYEIIAQVWKSAKLPQTPSAQKFLEQMTVNELFYGEENEQTYKRI